MVKFEMFGTVGEEITADSIRTFLNANKQNEIQFDIATLGGDLNTGLLIHDLIKTHPKKCIANIVGLTASAGTVIAAGCDEIQMSDNALFLIHNGHKEVEGNVYDMQKAVTDLAKTDAIMVKIYREQTGLPDAKIIDLMKASDWLSPEEAQGYGFVNRVIPSGSKIAASVVLTNARASKISEQLLIKLEKKMKLFGKKEPDKQVLNVLALAGGKSVLINAEAAATGVEVAPLGAMTLEDGEYELADGRKIVIAGGVITEVVEPEMAAAKPDTAAIVAAVAEVVTAEIAKVRAEISAEVKSELGKIKSTHIPAKGKGVDAGQASVKPEDVVGRVEAITNGIREAIVKSRQA